MFEGKPKIKKANKTTGVPSYFQNENTVFLSLEIQVMGFRVVIQLYLIFFVNVRLVVRPGAFGRASGRPNVQLDVRGRIDVVGGARVVSGAEKKAFDRGGPVWPSRSNGLGGSAPQPNFSIFFSANFEKF